MTKSIFIFKDYLVMKVQYTVVAGIKRLPPNHYAIFKDRKFEVKRWWN